MLSARLVRVFCSAMFKPVHVKIVIIGDCTQARQEIGGSGNPAQRLSSPCA